MNDCNNIENLVAKNEKVMQSVGMFTLGPGRSL